MSFFNKKKENENIATGIDAVSDRHLDDLKLKAKKADLPEQVARQVDSELDRLGKVDPIAAEFSIGINYIETLLALPWFIETKDNLDLSRAESILSQHHYGLQGVKARVLEYLAVKTLKSKQKSRILIVDDEDIARTNLLHYFRGQGYIVEGAINGVDALEKLETQQFFNLIITDLKMDQMDGLTLIEKVSASSPDTDIVMVTGYATMSTAVDALRKGATHYLAKPVQLDELRQTVEDVLAKQGKLQVADGPVLCFSGPPGTGKTSIARAVADSLGRKFVRLSMGGLRDEAEIRGHRRTYAGAMPGRIINEIKRAGAINACMLLDEIDKVGQDFRGDPASVLLEVLDPEQNSKYIDHYLEIPFDLSAVMFIATANDLDRLPGPLLDRLEVIEFSSYTLQEKRIIAQKKLLPRQFSDNGLTGKLPLISAQTIDQLIIGYTREAGVRGLNREIGTLCRKMALHSLKKKVSEPVEIDEEMLVTFLGPRKYRQEAAEGEDQVGVVTSLVWTRFGGEIMFIEALMMRGSTNLILTGSLGEVLRESAQIALSFIRSNAISLGIEEDFYDHSDIHIHLPAGAVSKDGPSAGLAIALALISLLTGRPIRRDVAVTGEMTLSSQILAVGGIREKLLASSRAGCRKVLLPSQNLEDIKTLPDDVTEPIEIIPVEKLKDAIDHLLREPI
ncbi:MAG: response regulator [Deltaproteobacteria bacterium]|nr:response regulator [Deltaproteobacteria bacterium]